MPYEELVLPFPGSGRREDVPSVTHAKGQWLVSSLRGIREHGRLDEYLRHLPARYHDTMLGLSVSDWHPLDVVLAHYQACELLTITPEEITRISRDATQRAQGTVIGITSRLVTSGGITPWTFIPQFQKFWDRMIRGGGISATKLGPKEAKIEVVGFPAARFRYCRIGMRGVLEAAISLLCTKAYVTEVPVFTNPDDAVLKLSWV